MKFKKQAVLLALSTILAVPLATSQAAEVAATKAAPVNYYQQAQDAVAKEALASQNMMSTVWYQHSVEAKALYIQAYNVAKQNLPAKLAEAGNKPAAIILDIDETVLDNSPQQAFYATTGNGYPTGWKEWVDSAQAAPVPGAKHFLQYAKSKGVDIFYVSDRSADQLEATIKNLQREQLPDADETHILLKKPGMKSKEGRRQDVAKKYHVIMLFGDNINDFVELDGLSYEKRIERLQEIAPLFGDTYYILPNPMYGSWEGVLYDYNFRIAPEKKMELRKGALQVFDYKNPAAYKPAPQVEFTK